MLLIPEQKGIVRVGVPARSFGDNVPIDPVARPWLSAESYWEPPRIVASGWLEHAPFAAWLVATSRPSRLVELGTHNGYSFFTFCDTVQRLGLQAQCFAVDTWEGDDHAGFYDDAVFKDVSSIADELYPTTATLLRGFFDDHVESFEDGSIDILHIDGRHGYEDVRHDFESWLPKVAPNGVVLFHDIAVTDRGFGVLQFWQELSTLYPHFSFEHGNGLGVLATGSYSASLASLFDAGEADGEAIRDFYSRRGAVMTSAYLTHVAHDREVQEILNSTSWRLTRPLRALSSLLTGRARS